MTFLTYRVNYFNSQTIFLVEQSANSHTTIVVGVESITPYVCRVVVSCMTTKLPTQMTSVRSTRVVIPQDLVGNGYCGDHSSSDGMDEPPHVAGWDVAILPNQGVHAAKRHQGPCAKNEAKY